MSKEQAAKILAKRIEVFPSEGTMTDEAIKRNVLAAMEEYAASKGAGVWVPISKDESNLPEENDVCLWCEVPICEPPYVASLADVDFPGKFRSTPFTHFMRLPNEFFPPHNVDV